MMRSTRNILAWALGCCLAVFALWGGGGLLRASASEAAPAVALTAKDFTDSDYLLKPDGTLSEETIQSVGKSIAEREAIEFYCMNLNQIIPQEMLLDFDTPMYEYQGKEYGFVIKHWSYSSMQLTSVAVMDFMRKDQNNTQTIRMTPVITEHFICGLDEAGNFTAHIPVQTAGLGKIYIGNPRLGANVLNSGELNYGDEGYDKAADNGVMIQQTRLNYGGFYQKVNADWKPLAQLAVQKAAGLALSKIGLGCVMTAWDVMVAMDKTFELETQVIECNNEENIATTLSREDQKNDLSALSYSRSYMTQINTPDLRMSAEYQSYAELIVLLNDTNTGANFTRIALYDVYRDAGVGEKEYFNEKNEEGNIVPFASVEGEFLFENTLNKTIAADKADQSFYLYLLAEGTRLYKLTPSYDCNYIFRAPENVRLQVVLNKQPLASGNGSVEIALEKGKAYEITAVGEEGVIGEFQSVMNPPDLTCGNNVFHYENSSYELFEFSSDKNYYYRIRCEEPGAYIDVRDEDMQRLVLSPTETYIQVGKGEKRYVVVSLVEESTKDVTVALSKEKKVTLKSRFAEKDENITLVNDQPLTLDDPDGKEGYAFDGWWDNQYYSGKRITAENFHEMDEFTAILHAKWNAVPYRVTYVTYSEQSMPDETYTVEQWHELTQPQAREGYIFKGWYDNAEFSGNPVEEIRTGNTGNRTFYAKWVQEKYTVSLNVPIETSETVKLFDADGNETDLTEWELAYGENFVLPVAKKTGYIFEGWKYGQQQLTNENGQSFQPFVLESDAVLSPIWRVKTLEIRINGKDENGNPKLYWLTKDSVYETIHTVAFDEGLCPNCQVTQWRLNPQHDIYRYLNRPGHKYLYLATSENGTELACWQQTFVELADNSVIQLYPIYAEEVYTLVFKTTETGEPVAQYEVNYNDDFVFPAGPAKTHYTFGGWKTGSDAVIYEAQQSIVIFDFSSGKEENANITFFADYDEVEYKIEFEMSGSTTVPDITYTISDVGSEKMRLPQPAAENYLFDGWYKYDDYTAKVEAIYTESAGNHVLYGRFVKKYTVAGGNLPQSGQTFLTENSAVTLTLPSRSEYDKDKDYEYYIGTWVVTCNGATVGEYSIGNAVQVEVDLSKAEQTITVEANWEKGVSNFVLMYSHNDIREYHVDWGTMFEFPTPENLIDYYGGYWLRQANNKRYEFGANVSWTESGRFLLKAEYNRDDTYTITDDGREKNPYDTVNLQTLTGINVKDSLYTSVIVRIELTYWEVNDGYQYLFLYSGSSTSSTLYEEVKMECGPGRLEENPQKKYLTFEIRVADLKSNDLYIRYGASGSGSDDWKNEIKVSADLYPAPHW